MNTELVTTRDVAKALHVSEATVRSYARDGVIPCVRTFGGHRRFDLIEVLNVWEKTGTAHIGGVVSAEMEIASSDKPMTSPAMTSPAMTSPAEEPERLKPIEISAAWKNDWALGAVSLGDASSDEDEDRDHRDILQPEPFPGVRGRTRFVVSRRLVGA